VEEPGTADAPIAQPPAGVDRRTLIKRAAAAGAVAWTAPLIVESFACPAAAASGVVTAVSLVGSAPSPDATDNSTSTSITLGSATTSGKTELILVARHSKDKNNDAVSSITGTAISSPVAITSNNYKDNGYLFAWRATGAGGTGLTVNFAKGNAKSTYIVVLELTGNDTTTPIVQSPTNTATGATSISATLASPGAGNAEALLVGILANSAITGPSGSGWATLAANNDANNNSFDVSFDSTAQTTASATFAKNDAGTIALEIKHA